MMVRGSREPLYLQIHEYFKELISTNQLAAHEKIPTEKEIMQQFNVSRITVTNALAELVKEGLIYRIPGKGSFVQDGAQQLAVSKQDASEESTQLEEPQFELLPAENLQHRNNNTNYETPILEEKTENSGVTVTNRKVIGLILPVIEDFFAIRLINGIYEVFNESEYMVTLMLSQNSKQQEREAIRELLRMQAVGLLIFPVDAEIYNEDILELKVKNFPFVLIDRYLPGVETNYVCSDNVEGAKLAVSHLWDLGHRNIAICSDSALPTITVDHRIKGYMDALKERETMINPNLIVTDFKVGAGHVDENHILYDFIKNRHASAYIALNAKLGVYIARIAKELSLRIPEDISIITFDDPSFDTDFGVYTHISQSEQDIGREAAKILIQVLEDQKHDRIIHYRKKNLSPKLIVKSTTGPVPQ
ncbi:MAG TPA: GntR family transcriptional regulator [Bacillaceae bacterium]|nr:GntR family transcriptional regulator [Bacillaceae bacterium]